MDRIYKKIVAVWCLLLCIGVVCATNYMPTDEYFFIIQNEWEVVGIATPSTVDINGETKPFNVSEYWKMEWEYIANDDDGALRIILRHPEGYLISYNLMRDTKRSSGTFYGQGAHTNVSLDVFAGRLRSWNVKMYTHA